MKKQKEPQTSKQSQSQAETDRYNEINGKYKYSQDELQRFYKKFNDFEKLYFGHIENKSNPWKSKVFDPETFEKVERMASHLFATRPRGRFLPRESSDTAGVRMADELFKYQWTKPGQDMNRKMKRIGKSMGVFGTAFASLHWRYERVKRNVRKEDGSKRKEWFVKWDDPFFQDLYIYDCYPDPSSMSGQDMEWFIHDEYVTMDSLKASNHKLQGEKRYKNLDLLEQKFKAKNKLASQDDYRTKAFESRGGGSAPEIRGRILIRRFYSKTEWVTLAPDFKLVIEDRENPYDHGELPIHAVTDHDYVNQLFGVGEIEPIESMQKGLNSIVNQRLDNVRIIMSPPVMVDPDSLYSRDWKFAPGRKWRVSRTERTPETFQFPDVTGNTFIQSSNYMKDAMSRALGHQDFLSKNESAEGRTATEIRAATGEQNARMRAKEHNVDEFITAVSTQWMQLNQQFITKARLVRIQGKEAMDLMEDESITHEDVERDDGVGGVVLEGQPRTTFVAGKEHNKFQKIDGAFGLIAVEPEDIQGAMDFIVETGGTTELDTAGEIDSLESSIKTLSDLEEKLAAQNKRINYQPLIERLVSLRGMKDVDSIIEEIEPPVEGGGEPQMGGDEQLAMMQQAIGGGLPQGAPAPMQGPGIPI